jgi:aconitate hydratase 2/2-methylisocitrate dehydratase
MGLDTRVYLASAELAAVAALLGRIPTVEEYLAQVNVVNQKAGEIYRYLNFDQLPEFTEIAETVAV